ncbi:unnamed protein product [Adineta steineri]|uniref:Kelch repeat protein n=1 Tax=Adineta steineri TaxID=433720 RepID=A0A819P099_9BILA|nr:unnamed protein product [Adineta steineri]CAF4005953.1 unnamed protein product [Adineta steineri]
MDCSVRFSTLTSLLIRTNITGDWKNVLSIKWIYISLNQITSTTSSPSTTTTTTTTTTGGPGWTITGNMSFAREYHTASILINGLVLVAGGFNSRGCLNSTELYHPSTGTWTTTGNMNFARGYHTASTLANGLVLVAGGSNGNGSLSSTEL